MTKNLFSTSRQLLAIAALCLASPVLAQDAYPSKPLRVIIGFPPGGAADTIARFYGEALARELRQTVMIDNRPGAGTTIAATYAAKAPADGYTLYIGGASLFGGDNLLYQKLSYTQQDFVPVSQLTSAPLILAVGSRSGIKDVADLVAKARQSPDTLTYSSSGNGVITHLAAVQFTKLAGVTLVHIPYKGGAPSAQSVAAGDTQLTFATPASIQPMIDAGKAISIGVTTANRSALMPNYPTIAEAGVPGYAIANWYGVFVAKGTPQPVVDRLFKATQTVLADPALRKQLADRGEEATPSSSQAAFQVFAQREGERYVELLKQSGATVD